MEYFTTYFTKKEIMTLSEEKNDFIYENIRRNENKEKDKSDDDDEAILRDFSIFKGKKSEKELIVEINELLEENEKVIIENDELKNEKDIKNCLIRYYILSKKKNTLVKLKEQKMEMSKDIENNYYMPELVIDSVLKNEVSNAINIHRIKDKLKFLNLNDLGVGIVVTNYDKYYNEYININ